MPFRVGFGFDVHRLEAGESFVLGGITLEHDKGPSGHSDADVLIHAICDALLGASNQRDIGYHFPNTDPRFKGIDSAQLLKEVVALVRQKGYMVVNVDATVVLELPKLSPHIEAMQQRLESIMGLEPDSVAVKATTNERLGFIGREEGVTAHAVALIERA